MSAFELSLIVSRVLNVAFNVYLLAIGLRALRAARGSFRHRAGITLAMLGAGLLLSHVVRVLPDPYSTIASIASWLGVALTIVGCVRFIRLLRTPDRRHEEIKDLFRLRAEAK